jgi:hypothetical protein
MAKKCTQDPPVKTTHFYAPIPKLIACKHFSFFKGVGRTLWPSNLYTLSQTTDAVFENMTNQGVKCPVAAIRQKELI